MRAIISHSIILLWGLNMNTLSILCKSYGWQGGTIHEALEHFKTLSMIEKDTICGKLVDNMHLISDLDNVTYLMKARNSHLTIKTLGAQ